MKRGKNDKQYFNDEEVFYEFEGKKKGKLLPTIIVLLVLSAFALFFLANNTNLLDNFLDRAKTVTDSNEVSMDKDFATGLRLASLERYDEAISYFEKVNFNKLSEADQELVLMTYLYSGNEQKALDLKEEIDEEIINVLLENDDLEKLKELETDSKLIHFEIAVLDNDYERIIELKDAERLEKDTRRANAIANAYYQLGHIEEAINFTAMMAHAGVNMWKTDNKMSENIELTREEVVKDDNGKSMLLNVIILFLFVIFLAFIVRFLIINRNTIKEEINARKGKNKSFKGKKKKKKGKGKSENRIKKTKKKKRINENDEQEENDEENEDKKTEDDENEKTDIDEHEDETLEDVSEKDENLDDKYSYYYEEEDE